jgi:hypothetical protein
LAEGVDTVTNRWKCEERDDGATLLVGSILIERDGTDYSGNYRITDRSAEALGAIQWNAGQGFSRLRVRRCIQCDGLFVGDHAATLCSDACERKHRAAKRRHRPSWLLRAERSRQVRAALTCAVCGVPLEAKRSTGKYCSGRCRQRWHRQTPPALRPVIRPGGRP